MHETHLSKIDLNLLVVLNELISARSVTGAARRLGLSQPAVSRAWGRLRGVLGDPLFVRTTSGLALTPRTEALRPGLERVLSGVEALVAGHDAFDPATASRLFTVIAADYAQATVLPSLLDRLAREAPSVQVRAVASGPGWEAMLDDGRADFIWGPPRKASQTIVWSKLFEEGFGFVVHRSHPAAQRPLTLARYLELRHVAVAPEGSAGNALDQHLAKLGVRRHVAAHVSSFLVVAPLVAGGQLGATLPRRIIEQQAGRWGLVERKLPFTLGFSVSQGWHERHRHDAGHAWFRQCVVEVGRSLAARA